MQPPPSLVPQSQGTKRKLHQSDGQGSGITEPPPEQRPCFDAHDAHPQAQPEQSYDGDDNDNDSDYTYSEADEDEPQYCPFTSNPDPDCKPECAFPNDVLCSDP